MTDTEHTPENGAASASLVLAADYLDDTEKVRVATANRVRALRDEKGAAGTAELARWEEQLKVLKDIEDFAVSELQRAMRVHPLGPFVKRTTGIGEKQAARLLASTGDLAERPNVAKLWAYCGLHVIVDDEGHGHAPKLRRGSQANWSTTARMRAYLIAESCVKHRCKECTEANRAREEGENGWLAPPENCTCLADGYLYRTVYDKARGDWAERDTSDGHKHLHALRVTAKTLLRDMWIEARKGAGLPHNKNRGPFAEKGEPVAA